ncbi:MAG TPA: hypothetical protein DCO86_04285 [Spirochaetaceae bacterium]|nr:hypothetical protein [Spirochaetaceae bacterium]
MRRAILIGILISSVFSVVSCSTSFWQTRYKPLAPKKQAFAKHLPPPPPPRSAKKKSMVAKSQKKTTKKPVKKAEPAKPTPPPKPEPPKDDLPKPYDNKDRTPIYD